MSDESALPIQRLKCLVGLHEWLRFEAYLCDNRQPDLDAVGCAHCHTVRGGHLQQPLPNADRSVRMDLQVGGELFTTHAKRRLIRGDY